MAQTAPKRTQSSTSLSRFYNAGTNGGGPIGEDEMADPRMDFCNAFWGQGDRGYEVVMARLRGAGRTLEELKAFWKERAAIEEDYSRRLQKLSKITMGKDEIGDLAAAIQNCLVETGQQAQYHQSLAGEIRTNVEQPTAELAARLVGFKKGQQASIEKAWRNKGLQEGHVTKARERYESDCLKLNSYTANQALTQGKEADKLQQKQERIRRDIGQSEGEFRQFVRVLEGTQSKWENEWKGFCDIVQDLEEDRLAMTKDIIWAYANAVSQVCVEDDSSCERVREKLEQFEPMGDMVAFVRGWGTGDQIPDPPRFINYSAGEYPPHPSSHLANFQRETNKTPLSSLAQYVPEPRSADEPSQREWNGGTERHQANGSGKGNGLSGAMGDLGIQDRSETPPAPPSGNDKPKAPFGGVALPGMAPPAPSSPAPATTEAVPKRYSSMGPPAPATTMTLPEPRVPSRQGPPTPNQVDDEDPMAKALADLRTQPPSGSIRRGASHRRPESMYSGAGSTVSRNGTPGITSPPPGSSGNRMSYQPPPSSALSPPPAGHTAAALAKSMDEFQRQSNSKRGSVSYSGYAQDVVGAHPSSRSASPAPSANGASGRGPTSAMMQPPSQPATHIADGVLSQYHQAFPGERERERSRSRAGSVASARSGGGNSFIAQPVSSGIHPPASPTPREGFSGIGAGGRSPSPVPPANFASPIPSPNVAQGNLGPQNMGIKLDASGGVAQDSMAEAYRRQYQQQQQGSYGHGSQGQGQGQGQGGMGGGGFAGYQAISQPSPQQQFGVGVGAGPNTGNGPKSPGMSSPPPIASQRPTSGYGQHQPPQHQQQQGPPSQYQQQPPNQYARPPSTNGSYTQQHPPRGQSLSSLPYQPPPSNPGPSYVSPSTGGYSNAAAPPSGYSNSYVPPGQPGPPQSGYGNQYAPPPQHQQQHQNQYQRSASPAPGPGPGHGPGQGSGYGRSPSPAPASASGPQHHPPPSMQHQQSYQSQQSYQRVPSPQPQPQHQQQQQPQQTHQGRPQSYQQQQQPQGQYGYQPPMSSGYGQQQQPPQQQHQQHPSQQNRMQRSPSPQPGVAPVNAAPTGQWSTTGLPVLFYVKALYDYQAQSGVEFDFQAGDIIAVTSTPEDGWWSGELLDEARRLPGRTDFPSNFVCLF